MLEIDAQIDNGNLLNGLFRKTANGFIYVIED